MAATRTVCLMRPSVCLCLYLSISASVFDCLCLTLISPVSLPIHFCSLSLFISITISPRFYLPLSLSLPPSYHSKSRKSWTRSQIFWSRPSDVICSRQSLVRSVKRFFDRLMLEINSAI